MMYVTYSGIPIEDDAFSALKKWGVTEVDIERLAYDVHATPTEFGRAIEDVVYSIQDDMISRSADIGSQVSDPSFLTVMDKLYEGCIMYIDSRTLEHLRG